MKSKKVPITIAVVAVVALAGVVACAPHANSTVVGNPTPNV